mgnify:CR=1 FL=1
MRYNGGRWNPSAAIAEKKTAQTETIIGSLWNRHKEHPHGYDD